MDAEKKYVRMLPETVLPARALPACITLSQKMHVQSNYFHKSDGLLSALLRSQKLEPFQPQCSVLQKLT